MEKTDREKINFLTSFLLIAFGAFLYWLAEYNGYINKSHQNVDAKAHAAPRNAYVTSEIKLGETGTLRIVRMPNIISGDLSSMDSQCILYADREARISNLQCIDAFGHSAQ